MLVPLYMIERPISNLHFARLGLVLAHHAVHSFLHIQRAVGLHLLELPLRVVCCQPFSRLRRDGNHHILDGRLLLKLVVDQLREIDSSINSPIEVQ